MKPRGTAHRVRLIIFRMVATLAWLFFVLPVAVMASVPGVCYSPMRKSIPN